MTTPADAIIEQVEKIRSQYKNYNKADRTAFIQNMVIMYHQMVASENLLKVALAQSKRDWLREYFEQHLIEEKDHAAWISNDLKSAGIEVETTNVPVHVVEMVGSIYYLIYHHDPLALLGYMLVMEAFTAPREAVYALEQLHGRDLLRTIRYHAENDPDHTEELKAIINNVPDAERYIVLQTAIQTAIYIGRISEDLHKYAIKNTEE